MQKNIVVCLGAMACCALWGSAFPCIKIGYCLSSIKANDVYSQILFGGIRFSLAGILAIALGSIINKKILIPKKQSLGKIVILSLLQTVIQYILFYIGLANTTGVKASIIESINVFVAILVASILYKQEKLTKLKIIGCILGFTGVVLVNMAKGGFDMTMQWKGEGFILLSTVAYAFSSVALKTYSKDEDPVTLSGYQFILGGLIMSIFGTLMGGQLNLVAISAIGMLVYLSLISAVAYSLWGILLKYNTVSKVSVFGFMNPIFGVILSILLLNGENRQTLGLKSIVALILVCMGIYTVNHRHKRNFIDEPAII